MAFAMVELEIPPRRNVFVTVRGRLSKTAGTALSSDLFLELSPLETTAPEREDELPCTRATVSGGEWAVVLEPPDLFFSYVQELGASMQCDSEYQLFCFGDLRPL